MTALMITCSYASYDRVDIARMLLCEFNANAEIQNAVYAIARVVLVASCCVLSLLF